MAFFLGEWLFDIRDRIGMTGLLLGWSCLAIYAASVVGGRLYTGMHSIADVMAGSLLGVACWALWLVIGNMSEAWVDSGSAAVPTIAIPLTLTLVHYHPEPVDDCPCFEDAIAVLSVVLGSYIGHWRSTWQGSVILPAPHVWIHGSGMGIVVAVVRIAFGIGILFAWRLFAKAVLLTILPPIFRASSRIFEFDLPTRKHYTAGTAYSQIPPTPLRTIPSFIDLQTTEVSTDVTPNAESPTNSMIGGGDLQSSSQSLTPPPSSVLDVRLYEKPSEVRQKNLDDGHLKSKVRKRRKDPIERAKYDAEVLTKVGVYSGIGLLATTLIPAMFERAERSLLAP
ncbi:MAG: Sphingosine-1-phosphate phosphatase 2 [Tremellales sp. Tagirdzhanova-0007]|nr:MAG: Sphingosine-1-phosphate phosphatase 2 [Tremellales sp. Tagirdzhanova-0007]